jgi:hypothetical protein
LSRRFFEAEKKLHGFFRFREIRKKPKNHIFWLSQQKMGSMGGTFTIPEFNSAGIITLSAARQLVRCHDNEVTLEHYQCSRIMS